MKRSSFLQISVAAAAALMAIPKVLKATFRMPGRGFAVKAGKDRFDKSITLMEGDTFYTKVATADTDGGIFVFESSRIKNGGPALHYHHEQDEWWYVLQGEFKIRVGDELYEAKPGDSIFGPRGVPHAFEKVGEGEAKLLMFYQPAGKMEAYFKAISEGFTKGMKEEERVAFAKAHGIERVGPAMGHLKQ